MRRKGNQPWHLVPPLAALAEGVPLPIVLHQSIRTALHRSLIHGFVLPVRATGESLPVGWYGQQEAYWVGYYDALRRLGLASYGPDESEHLTDWAALVRSCGWWWPDEDVCVMVERPQAIATDPVPGTWHDELRLADDGVTYRDGWRPLRI